MSHRSSLHADVSMSNRENQGDVTQSCSYKTFRSCGAKEFFSAEGAVGLLTWFEGIEFVLHISKSPAESQVKFASCLAPKIKENATSSKPNTIQSAVSMANRLTTDGIKNGIFMKKENAGNKKRSNDQFKNQGRNDRNKRQRTGRNFAITAPDQGQGKRQYAG
ncbi:hypothetical protein Tco_0139671 [Tanacetum coccineum]